MACDRKPGWLSLEQTPTHQPSHHRAVILSAVFHPAKRDESKGRTSAFRATLHIISAQIHSGSASANLPGVWALLSSGMHGSFVGSPSHSEGLRFLKDDSG